ncbi:SKP1-like 11 [Euphorbia peplus]|nr:SKP1-like 11 [Euphorbia peplus]
MSSTGNTTNTAVSPPPLANTITLKTGDKQYFQVEECIAMEFAIVKAFFDDNDDSKYVSEVPLPNVYAKHLRLIIQYCEEQLKFRAEANRTEEEKQKYDEKFVADLSDNDMKEMILAVSYLEIKSFLDMLCQSVADRIKDWSVQRVREFFGIPNDFSPEEEEKVRQENSWAFEDVES